VPFLARISYDNDTASGVGTCECTPPQVRAQPHCRFVLPLIREHPLYTRFTNILGASISEATMRPNPTAGVLKRSTARGYDATNSVPASPIVCLQENKAHRRLRNCRLNTILYAIVPPHRGLNLRFLLEPLFKGG
jgi:hypothetical protein